MIRHLSLLFLFVALGAGIYVCYDTWEYFHLPPEQKMQRLWEEDMAALDEAKMLPPAWQSIREVRWVKTDDESMKIARKLNVPVKIKKDGDYRLDILFVPWAEEGKMAAFLQYDLVDLKSKNENTIWENSRTLILSDKNSWVEKLMNGTLEKEMFQK